MVDTSFGASTLKTSRGMWTVRLPRCARSLESTSNVQTRVTSPRGYRRPVCEARPTQVFAAGKSFSYDSSSLRFSECCYHESSCRYLVQATAENIDLTAPKQDEGNHDAENRGRNMCDTPNRGSSRCVGGGGHLPFSSAAARLTTPSNHRNDNISTLPC